MTKILDFLKTKLGRTGVPLFVALITLGLALWLGISEDLLGRAIFKFLIFAPAVVLVHAVRRTLFPYIDMSSDYGSSEYARNRELQFAAMIVFYCWMTSILVNAI